MKTTDVHGRPIESKHQAEEAARAEVRTPDLEGIERLQAACRHPRGINPEDGCIDCGFYAK